MTVVPRSGSGKGMEPRRESEGTLIHVVETLLDKGLVLNADIMVSVAGVELLGIRLRAALASFETAARYGLEFPAGTDTSTAAWQEAIEQKETCPECGKRAPLEMLMNEYCPWCGWQSALSLRGGSYDSGERELAGSQEASGSTTDPGSSEDTESAKRSGGAAEPESATDSGGATSSGGAKSSATPESPQQASSARSSGETRGRGSRSRAKQSTSDG